MSAYRDIGVSLSVVPKSSRRLDTPSSGLNCGQVVIDRQRRRR